MNIPTTLVMAISCIRIDHNFTLLRISKIKKKKILKDEFIQQNKIISIKQIFSTNCSLQQTIKSLHLTLKKSHVKILGGIVL